MLLKKSIAQVFDFSDLRKPQVLPHGSLNLGLTMRSLVDLLRIYNHIVDLLGRHMPEHEEASSDFEMLSDEDQLFETEMKCLFSCMFECCPLLSGLVLGEPGRKARSFHRRSLSSHPQRMIWVVELLCKAGLKWVRDKNLTTVLYWKNPQAHGLNRTFLFRGISMRRGSWKEFPSCFDQFLALPGFVSCVQWRSKSADICCCVVRWGLCLQCHRDVTGCKAGQPWCYR